jgi:hypothetical protein
VPDAEDRQSHGDDLRDAARKASETVAHILFERGTDHVVTAKKAEEQKADRCQPSQEPPRRPPHPRINQSAG